jgi:hypothetical protein
MLPIDKTGTARERACILGVTSQGAFAIKRTTEGYRCFVKVKNRWWNAPSAALHLYVPGGVSARVRVFVYDATRAVWLETRTSIALWHAEMN